MMFARVTILRASIPARPSLSLRFSASRALRRRLKRPFTRLRMVRTMQRIVNTDVHTHTL